MQVTVIAVTEFDDRDLANKPLVEGIKAATTDIESFFIKKYGVIPRIFSSRDETTASAIRKWLFYDLSRESQPSIHLIFVLSHGIGYQYSGSTIFKNELFIATSDTKSDDYFGEAIRGSELVDAFQRLSAGSSAFLFLDTCGSGSIANNGMSQLLQANDVIATHFMILAASMAEQNAFRARFTKALLDIWGSPDPPPNDCHYGEDHISSYVTARMDALEKLDKRFSQAVSLVHPYTGEFCIESFASQTALALLANPKDEELKITLTPIKDRKDTIFSRVRPRSVKPVVLRREGYTVDVESVFPSSPLPHNSIPLDFSVDFIHYQPLYQPDLLESALSQQQAAGLAAEWGVPQDKVIKLLNSAKDDMQRALIQVTDQARQIQQTLALQQSKVHEANDVQMAKEQQVAAARSVLSARQNEMEARARNFSFEGVGGVGGSSQAGQASLEGARAAVDHAKADAEASAFRLDEETHRLSAAQDAKIAIEARLRHVKNLLADSSASAVHAETKRQTRAKLMVSLNAIFPTRDESRGLIISLPAERTQLQINQVGELLASTGAQMLIEIEVYVSGGDHRKSQGAATRLAEAVRSELLQKAGVLRNWTVARGFPALVKRGEDEGIKIESIVISGDFIGKSPLPMD